MTPDAIIVGVVTGLASSAWGWYERRKRAKAAAAEAKRQQELITNVKRVQAGAADIQELLDYVRSLDPLWRPKPKAK